MFTSSNAAPSNLPDSSSKGKRPQQVDTDQDDQISSSQALDLEIVWTQRNLLSLGNYCLKFQIGLSLTFLIDGTFFLLT
jgi:hypothetical protein